jgi:hypothetical protein
VHRRPAFPTPSQGRKITAKLGRIAPRDREVVSPVIARSAAQPTLILFLAARWIASLALAMTLLGCLKIEFEREPANHASISTPGIMGPGVRRDDVERLSAAYRPSAQVTLRIWQLFRVRSSALQRAIALRWASG